MVYEYGDDTYYENMGAWDNKRIALIVTLC